jgi:hypothetical protein
MNTAHYTFDKPPEVRENTPVNDYFIDMPESKRQAINAGIDDSLAGRSKPHAAMLAWAATLPR